MWEYNHTDELYHHGVKGMKWGVRRARRQNAKVDKSFKKWKENSNKKPMLSTLVKKLILHVWTMKETDRIRN